MASAVTMILGADGRPMEAEFAKQEIIAKRFGKTIQEVNAETYGAENAQMERNREALRALIAEKQAAIAEQERYNAALMANTGGLGTAGSVHAAEDAILLKNSAALRELNAERIKAREELQRYEAALMANTGGLKTVVDLNKAENDALLLKSARLKQLVADRAYLAAAQKELDRYEGALKLAATPFGGNQRAMNAADQEAWLIKLAAAKGITVETLKAAQAAKEAELAARGISSGIGAAAHGVPGLNLVLRETLVIFREIGRGNWARVPGSFSLVLQGLRQMRSELGIFGALFTLTGAIVVGSVVAIVASFFIWEHRVNALAKALENLKVPDIAPPDISRLTAFEKGWNRIRDAIAEAAEEINNANANFERTKSLLDQAQGTEKKLLEIAKEKALDAAGNDPAARAKIRAEYAKKEHDLEKQQQDEQMAASARHIKDLQAEQDAKLQAARDIKVETEADEKVHQEILDKAAKEGTEKRKDKKGNDIQSQLEEDQGTIERLQDKAKREVAAYDNYGNVIGTRTAGLGQDDQATLDAAQGRLADHQRAVLAKAEYDRTKKDRDDARQEQARLFDEAAKAGADKIRAAKAYNAALALNHRILADDDKLRAAQNDEKNNSTSGREARGYSLNSQQRIGAYVATAPILFQQLRALQSIDHKVTPVAPPSNHPPGERKPQLGTRPKVEHSGGWTTTTFQ